MAKKKSKQLGHSKPPTPPQPKPWDVPPQPKKGDTKKDTLFVAVGSALSSWERLEECLAIIFGDLVAPDLDTLAAQRAYGSVLTSRGRGELITAAADAVFFLAPNDTLQHELRDLIIEIGRFAARRNELAHGKITTCYRPPGLFLPGGRGMRERPAGYVLGPTQHATNKTTLRPGRMLLETAYHKPSYAYSSKEIEAFQEHFLRLSTEVRKIGIKIMRHQHARRKASQ